MQYKLRTKLSISYVLVILVCVSIIIILSNIVFERQFSAYVTSQQQQQTQNTLLLLTESYSAGEEWDASAIEDIGMNALDNGLIVKVTDTDGTVVWDAATHNSGMCQQMLTKMGSNMQSRYGNWAGGYEEEEYTVTYKNQTTGIVNIGYYGPFFYTDSDLSFIKTINSLILWAGVFSAVLAFAIGIIMSRQISNPISRVIAKAQRIAQGSYGEIILDKTKTREIRRLVDTINKLAETLQKQEERSTQASSDIAHELRTPLATIQGNLEAVMDGVMELNPERIKVLYEEILRISRLVDTLSELARYERKETALHKTRFAADTLIRETFAAVQGDFDKEGKTLLFEGSPQTLSADRDKIHQVLVNLLSNALKYTQPGDTVTVSLSGNADTVVIRVSDTGAGIADEDLPYIFERFYRADKSRSRKSGGAGIGLTIVKSITTAHGGSISVSSKLGTGTDFTITLPRE